MFLFWTKEFLWGDKVCIFREDVSPIAMQTGETSFICTVWFKAYQTYTRAQTMRWKHTWFFLNNNKTATFVIVWDLIVFKLLSDTLSEMAMCIFSSSLDSLILTHLLAWTLSSLLEELPFLKLWACNNLPQAWRSLAFSEIFRLGQTFRLCSFKRT